MTTLVRKATLLSVLGVVAGGAALAAVPNAATSTRPSFINATGYASPAGQAVPDPAGNVLYVIRDANYVPKPHAEIVLDFTACTDIRLSQSVSGNGGVVDCGLKRIVGTTNALGELTLSVVAGGNGSSPPRAVRECVLVTVNGVPFPNIVAASFDRDGAGGVGASDFGLCISDFVHNPFAGRSDFDDSGVVGARDLGLLIGVFVSGASALSGSLYCP